MNKIKNYSEESYNKAYTRIMEAIETAERNENCRIHIGTANGKTSAVNEGTSPLATCCAHACKTCGRNCYAVWHIDNRLPACRRNHAENTVMRRRDALAYYRAFFQAANKSECKFLRVNETGDFENADQLGAFFCAATEFPSVRVIGYTRRPELAEYISKLPANVSIRYSHFMDGATFAPGNDAETLCGRVCRVSETETTCPSQIAKDNGRTWTCADCVKNNCGCFGKCPCVTFRAH